MRGWKIGLMFVVLVALVATAVWAQCPNGNCAVAQVSRERAGAWRYERPEGYRQAVVRIYCTESGRTRSLGSGVLVKWGTKLVVLTARHVVKDAKEIIVGLVTNRF